MPLPYPTATSTAVSTRMRANRKTNTKPELRLRSALHRRGLRYRVGTVVTAGTVRVVPDVLFPRARIAVFVDGCWWHQCPDHATPPTANTDYWLPKLARNVERDRRVNEALIAEAWTVLRIWEHDLAEPDAAAAFVDAEISRR